MSASKRVKIFDGCWNDGKEVSFLVSMVSNLWRSRQEKPLHSIHTWGLVCKYPTVLVSIHTIDYKQHEFDRCVTLAQTHPQILINLGKVPSSSTYCSLMAFGTKRQKFPLLGIVSMTTRLGLQRSQWSSFRDKLPKSGICSEVAARGS